MSSDIRYCIHTVSYYLLFIKLDFKLENYSNIYFHLKWATQHIFTFYNTQKLK